MAPQPYSVPPLWDCPFKQALLDQNRIGWYPLLLGHVSNHWQGVQQKYYDWLNLQNTGRQWVKQLILQLFRISWDMWEHRNGIKHQTMTPAKLLAQRKVDDLIRAEYNRGYSDLLPQDKKWLDLPLLSLLENYTLVQKKQWLASVSTARCRWKRRREIARASLDASQRLMRR